MGGGVNQRNFYRRNMVNRITEYMLGTMTKTKNVKNGQEDSDKIAIADLDLRTRAIRREIDDRKLTAKVRWNTWGIIWGCIFGAASMILMITSILKNIGWFE